MPKKRTVTTRLKKFKTCKSCVRFNTVDAANEKALISIYVKNETLKKLGNPDEIFVTLSAAEEEE